jgi:hypothetical protein
MSCVRIHVHVYVHVPVRVHVHVYVHVPVRVHVHVRVCIHVRVHAHVHVHGLEQGNGHVYDILQDMYVYINKKIDRDVYLSITWK